MENRIVTIVFSIFITVALALLLIWPRYEHLSSLYSQLNQLEKRRENAEKYSKDLRDKGEKLKEHKKELDIIKLSLPYQPGILSLFDFIQNLANNDGLTLQSIGGVSEATLARYPDIQTISIPFSVVGSYRAFKNFINDLSSNVRIIEIESIGFSGSTKKAAPLVFSLQIKTHFIKKQVKKQVKK